MTKEEIPDLHLFVKAIMDRKAMNVVILNVKKISTVADAFIICSGRSSRQVVAISDHIQSEMRDQGIRPSSVEGKVDGHWVLMDYRDVVIHIFFESTRDFFDLEGLWRDAPRISPEDVLNAQPPAP